MTAKTTLLDMTCNAAPSVCVAVLFPSALQNHSVAVGPGLQPYEEGFEFSATRCMNDVCPESQWGHLGKAGHHCISSELNHT